MRIFDRDSNESTKAFEAWTIYRDLGAQRSLQKTAELYYGTAANVRQLERWSSRFNWVERARASDGEREMLRRVAIEEYLATQADDHAEREGRIAEILLTVREEAAKQALSMVRWPLSERRIVQEDEDGNEIAVILTPAKWTKNTAIGMARLAAGAVPGLEPVREDSGEADAEWDLSVLSEEEMLTFLAISEKICVQGKGQPGKRVRQVSNPANYGTDQSGAAYPGAAIVRD
jgi:hypothetical protein